MQDAITLHKQRSLNADSVVRLLLCSCITVLERHENIQTVAAAVSLTTVDDRQVQELAVVHGVHGVHDGGVELGALGVGGHHLEEGRGRTDNSNRVNKDSG